MFLRVVRATVSKGVKRDYVRVVEAYRDDAGKTQHRTVINLGRRDLLAAHLDFDKLRRLLHGDAVASDSGLTKTDSARAIDSLLDTVTRALRKGDEVTITGFGKFSVINRAARQGVNPRTGERVQIAATIVPKFSAGSQLKAALKPSS